MYVLEARFLTAPNQALRCLTYSFVVHIQF